MNMKLLHALLVTFLSSASAHGTHENGRHHHDHDHDHDHHDHDHSLHDHHDVMELSAKEYEQMVANDKHAWVVKFHSGMCGACASFKPAYESAHNTVDGLHWAAIDIDNKANMPLAKRMGVLDEGIPNVKLVNVQEVSIARDVRTHDGCITLSSAVYTLTFDPCL